MGELLQGTNYINDMQPLVAAVKIIFQLRKSEFKVLTIKYQDQLFGKSGTLEFEAMISKHIKEVNEVISKSYKKKVLNQYFTEYGTILLIHDSLKTLYINQGNDQGETFDSGGPA